jgi:hypothetical protein
VVQQNPFVQLNQLDLALVPDLEEGVAVCRIHLLTWLGIDLELLDNLIQKLIDPIQAVSDLGQEVEMGGIWKGLAVLEATEDKAKVLSNNS